jgi:hypothetical protein
MRKELGDTHRAIKTVMRWTSASERTVKNWFSGQKGPSGNYLLGLIQESDAVLHALLHAGGRDDVLNIIGVSETDERGGNETEEETPEHRRQRDRSPERDSVARRARIRPGKPPDDPINDSINDPDRDPINPLKRIALNERQRWFFDELSKGTSVRTVDIMRRWEVAERTAKRDISALKVCGLIEFVGSLKRGGYRLMSR